MPYEIAVMGIPCIVLAQNEFETSLDFPKEKHGFVHLGPGRKIKQSSLLNAIMEPLLHEPLRRKAIERQVALNLGEGKEMVCEAILYHLEYPKRGTLNRDGKKYFRYDIVGKKIGVFPLDKKQIEREIAELKMEYVNLQGDIEKLESVGQNRFVAKSEVRLGAMEEKLAMLNKKLS